MGAKSVAPFQILKINGTGFDPDVSMIVSFSTRDVSLKVSAESVHSTFAQVIVPPYITNQKLGTATVLVSVTQGAQTSAPTKFAKIKIAKLTKVSGNPGSFLTAFLAQYVSSSALFQQLHDKTVTSLQDKRTSFTVQLPSSAVIVNYKALIAWEQLLQASSAAGRISNKTTSPDVFNLLGAEAIDELMLVSLPTTSQRQLKATMDKSVFVGSFSDVISGLGALVTAAFHESTGQPLTKADEDAIAGAGNLYDKTPVVSIASTGTTTAKINGTYKEHFIITYKLAPNTSAPPVIFTPSGADSRKDYTLQSANLTFDEGTGEYFVSPSGGNLTVEIDMIIPASNGGIPSAGSQTLTLTLVKHTLSGYTINAGQGSASITLTPSIPVASVKAQFSGTPVGKTTDFTIMLDRPAPADLSVAFTIKGTAQIGVDYSGLKGADVTQGTGLSFMVLFRAKDQAAKVVFQVTAIKGNSDTSLTVDVNLQSGNGYTVDPDPLKNSAETFLQGSAPVITSSLSASGTIGTPFNYPIAASGSSPITFTAAPLPPGLTFAVATISGTPTTAGTYTVTLTANNGTTPGDSKTLTITVSGTPPPKAQTQIKGTITVTIGPNADFLPGIPGRDSLEITASTTSVYNPYTNNYSYEIHVFDSKNVEIVGASIGVSSPTQHEGAGTINPPFGSYTVKVYDLAGNLYQTFQFSF